MIISCRESEALTTRAAVAEELLALQWASLECAAQRSALDNEIKFAFIMSELSAGFSLH